MNIITINHWTEVTNNFTGIAEHLNGHKFWYKEGKLHRLDGPAFILSNGYTSWYKEGKRHRVDGPAGEIPGSSKYWFLEGKEYTKIILKDYIVLDHYQGEYGLMWYKLLDKDQIIEYPDIPELIKK